MIFNSTFFYKVIRFLYQEFDIVFRHHKRKKTTEALDEFKRNTPLRLHMGCGRENWKGWINLDFSSNSAADVIIDHRKIKNYFEQESVEEIVMIHNISYLRYWEAKSFFRDSHQLLKKNGKLILEFPDIDKCAQEILNHRNNLQQYLKAIQGIYAFDMIQIAMKEKFTTYAFGWSGWHISEELKLAGFSSVQIKEPQTHDQLTWRDTRIEAIKIMIINTFHWSLFDFNIYDLVAPAII